MTPNFADFREVGLADREIIQSHLFRQDRMSCEQNYCNMFNWSPSYQYRWMLHEDRLLVRLDAEGSLLFPIGEYFPPAKLAALADMLHDNGMTGGIFDVPADYLTSHPNYDQFFSATSSENEWDYIYSTEKLHILSGSKLRKKRNHIVHFENNFPSWRTIPLLQTTVDEYKSFITRLYEGIEATATQQEDYLATQTALQYHQQTGLDGLALHNGEEIVAMALFSRQNRETYTVHFEKSDKDIPGASQMINLQTAAYLRDKCRYLNREQDLGIPGLRHAKRSYDPEFLLQNYHFSRLLNK